MNNIKKEVKNKIIEYSNDEYLEGYIKNEFLAHDGDANIYIRLKEKGDLFDERTFGSQLELDSQIYEYLNNKSAMLNNDIQINFHIVGLDLKSEEKEQVKHLIKEHYAIELYKIQKEHKRLRNKVLNLLLLGLFFMLFYIMIALSFNFDLFIEVFGFLVSFTIWEGFDCMIYDLSDIKLERESITQKLLLDVYFDL